METKLTNPVKVIRAKCLDCCCGDPYEVKLCTATRCPLHPFRDGKNPYRQKPELSKEEKNRRAELAGKAREIRREKKQTDSGV